MRLDALWHREGCREERLAGNGGPGMMPAEMLNGDMVKCRDCSGQVMTGCRSGSGDI